MSKRMHAGTWGAMLRAHVEGGDGLLGQEVHDGVAQEHHRSPCHATVRLPRQHPRPQVERVLHNPNPQMRTITANKAALQPRAEMSAEKGGMGIGFLATKLQFHQ